MTDQTPLYRIEKTPWFLMLWRRWWVLVGGVVLALGLCAGALHFMTPSYSAQVVVSVEDDMPLGAELEALYAPALLARLGAGKPDQKGFRGLSAQVGDGTALSSSGLEDLQDALYVETDPEASLLIFGFSKDTAEEAARLSNLLATHYVENRLNARRFALEAKKEFTRDHLARLDIELQEAEDAIQDHKKAHDLVEDKDGLSSLATLSRLNGHRVALQIEDVAAQAVLAQIEALGPDLARLDQIAGDFPGSGLGDLRAAIQMQVRQIEILKTRYGDKHPKMIEAQATLAMLKTDQEEALKALAEHAADRVARVQGEMTALDFQIEQLKAKRFSEDAALIKLRVLEDKVRAVRAAKDKAMGASLALDAQDPGAGVRILSYAVPPLFPDVPDRPRLLILSALIGFLLALWMAYGLDRRQNNYRSGRQLESDTGFPCYALIPVLRKKTQAELVHHVMREPAGSMAEAVRTLRTVLKLRSEGSSGNSGGAKVVALTSSLPGEGKTTLTLWLGRLAAQAGERVLVIDADLRRPNVHKALEVKNASSLVDYLTGHKALEQVVQKDEASGLDVIYGCSVPNRALALLSSQKMKELIDQSKSRYDLILIDSPASLAVSDARLLATLADQTLYTVAWNRTPRHVVLSGLRQFADMGYKALATVLSGVDVERHMRYGYGDALYYYGRYKDYYAPPTSNQTTKSTPPAP